MHAGRATFIAQSWCILGLLVPWATILFGAWLDETSVTVLLFLVAAVVPISGGGYLAATAQVLPTGERPRYRRRLLAGTLFCGASFLLYAWILVPFIVRLFMT